jgi:hypothetical protein
MAGWYVQDERRWDFSILDDEVADNPDLTPQARAAYWSIVRHARKDGYTGAPPSDLMRSAGIKKRSTWRRARRELVGARLISAEARPRRPHIITLLPVVKSRRPQPVVVPIGTKGGADTGPLHGPKRDHHMVPIGTKPIITLETESKREKSGSPTAVGGEAEQPGKKRVPLGEHLTMRDRWWAPYCAAHGGEAPQTQGVFEAWVGEQGGA